MILVPVKNLRDAKQRLSPALTREERSALASAMLQDVLDALSQSGSHKVALVTGDADAKKLAAAYSFEVIEDTSNPGETGAIEMATRVCVERGETETLVFPGDIPLITAREVQMIIDCAPPHGTVLVPSVSGRGSNGVLRRPANLIPLRFGNDSFVPHLAAARATGKPARVLKLSGIGLDVDEPADLSDLLAAPGSTRAQRLLGDWHIDERLLHAAAG
jgi:2-phospho-L-lactate/phosphoenolpyruvate guanylyltransferase